MRCTVDGSQAEGNGIVVNRGLHDKIQASRIQVSDMPQPLSLVIIADQKIARVKQAWEDFHQFLRQQPLVEIVAVDSGHDLDFSRISADLGER